MRNDPTSIETFYSIAATARAIGFTPATVRRAIADGRVSAVRILDRWRVPRSEVERLLSLNRPVDAVAPREDGR